MSVITSSVRRAVWLIAAVLAVLAFVVPAWAQSLFENPVGGSAQSGIGMFSGWVCDADSITIEVDGTTIIQAAYGTPRGDTEPVCGDENNGFGVLWNFNLFGNGTHTAVAKADGVAFGTRTFTVVKPTDANFATGLAASYSVPFPPGESVQLVWQTGTQNFSIAPPGAALAGKDPGGASLPAATTIGIFENPGGGSFVSGVIVFSGWLCNAETLEIVVDATTRITPAYGTSRGDTEEICGDRNNGFGVLWNSNLFGSGEHTAELLVDGMPFATRTFTVTVPTDETFPTDLSGTFRLPEFPDEESDVVVEWQTALQNFLIKSKQATEGPTPTPIPTPTPSGEFCGNGIVDGDEDCDGEDLDGFDCALLYAFDPEQCTGAPVCTSDCRFDGSACDCDCESDADCDLPLFHEIDCSPTYCSEACAPPDVSECECIVHFGTCFAEKCVTTPADPDILPDLCFGFEDDDPDSPRCDFCEE